MHILDRGGTEPGSARLGSARLVTIEEKSSEKARLEPGSVTFGSWLGSFHVAVSVRGPNRFRYQVEE